MKQKKELKTKRIYTRVTGSLYKAVDDYARENNTTKTKIIEGCLKELLKDRLGK